MIDPNNILTPEEANQIKDLYDKISKSDDNRNHKLLTINTTIFAIVVTLTSFDKANKLLFYLYLVTLLLFVLSIISGYIIINTTGQLYKKALDKYIKHIVDIKLGTKKDINIMVSTTKSYKFKFYIFEISTYLSLILLATFTVVKQLL